MAGKRVKPMRAFLSKVMEKKESSDLVQLSVKTGIPRDTLDEMSGKKEDYPEYRKLRDRAQKLGISVQELVDGLLDD